MLAPTLPAVVSPDPGSAAGVMLLIRETTLGLAMGFSMRLVFFAVNMAGDIMGLQMGLGFAQFYDPQTSAQVPVIGQFVGLLATLAFLALNGHLMLIGTLAESFRGIPPAHLGAMSDTWIMLARWGGIVIQAAVLLSLPVVAALLITNTALGVLSRAAPQLNIFAIGFPITLTVGFIALLLALPYLLPHFEKLFDQGLQTALRAAALPAR